MLRIRRAKPVLESLESRFVPATVKLIGGNLFISDVVGPLTVTATANNTFKVDDAGKIVSGLKAGSGVFITGANKGQTITFDLQGNNFSGNLFINARNGNDIVEITGTGTATIGGNVTVLTGLGNDTINMPLSGGQIRIGGSFTAVDNAGFDTLNILNSANINVIGGNATAVGYNQITVGNVADLIGGNLTLSSPSDGNNTTVLLADGLTVGRNVTVLTGNKLNSFNLAQVTIGGNLNVDLGSGTSSGADLGASLGGGTVAGNAFISSSGGAGVLTDGEGINIFGNLFINYGNGNYNFALNNSGKLFVAGNLFMNVGNGNSIGTLLATVSGNISITFGNGDNDFTIINAPGGMLNYRTGNGNNTLTLGDGNVANGNFLVNIRFGSGNDTLVMDINNTNILNGYIDFNGDDGTGDTFTQTSGTLSPTLTIVGLP